jgi:hypothetical protein
MSKSGLNGTTHARAADPRYHQLYRIGGAAAVGVVLVMVTEILVTFLPGGGATGHDSAPVLDIAMIFAMIGGLSSIAWYALIARKLFRLGQPHQE